MSTCGYVCPQCEGNGLTSDGEPCHWCTAPALPEPEVSDEVWLRETHEGKCCADD